MVITQILAFNHICNAARDPIPIQICDLVEKKYYSLLI